MKGIKQHFLYETTLTKENNIFYVEYSFESYNYKAYIPNKYLNKAKEGDIVNIEILPIKFWTTNLLTNEGKYKKLFERVYNFFDERVHNTIKNNFKYLQSPYLLDDIMKGLKENNSEIIYPVCRVNNIIGNISQEKPSKNEINKKTKRYNKTKSDNKKQEAELFNNSDKKGKETKNNSGNEITFLTDSFVSITI